MTSNILRAILESKTILLEYDRKKTLALFGEKIGKRLMDDPGAETESTSRAIDRMERADPSSNKQFVRWIATKYANGGINSLEDLPRVKDALQMFMDHQRELDERDIGRYKTLNELESAVSRFETAEEKDTRSEKKKLVDDGEAEMVYDSPELQVMIPKTVNASRVLGRNTKWCTAAKESNAFNTYNKSGPLYIILDKKGNRRWQLWMPRNSRPQFMDSADQPISITSVVNEFPKLLDIFDPIARETSFIPLMKKVLPIDKARYEMNMKWSPIDKMVSTYGKEIIAEILRDDPSLIKKIYLNDVNHNFSTPAERFASARKWLENNPDIAPVVMELADDMRFAPFMTNPTEGDILANLPDFASGTIKTTTLMDAIRANPIKMVIDLPSRYDLFGGENGETVFREYDRTLRKKYPGQVLFNSKEGTVIRESQKLFNDRNLFTHYTAVPGRVIFIARKKGKPTTMESYDITPDGKMTKAGHRAMSVSDLVKKVPAFEPVIDEWVRTGILKTDPLSRARSQSAISSEDEQIALVKKSGIAIRNIENPSRAVQLAAVSKNGRAIKFIKDPDEEIQLLAARANPMAIGMIKNQSDAVKWFVINNSSWPSYAYIKRPTPEMVSTMIDRIVQNCIKRETENSKMGYRRSHPIGSQEWISSVKSEVNYAIRNSKIPGIDHKEVERTLDRHLSEIRP